MFKKQKSLQGGSAMCELFGFTSEYCKNLTPDLTEFFSHSAHHPNGWGIAVRNGKSFDIQTEPICANKSKILDSIINNMKAQNFLLAHIRLATVGQIQKNNCHPFTSIDKSGRQWILIHNGTIFNGTELFPYFEKQEGDTDSERILLHIITQINKEIDSKRKPPGTEARIRIIENTIHTLSYRNKLNLLIYDSEYLYVHTNMKNTLYCKKQNGSAMFATTPLDNALWHKVPMCALQVYQNGVLKYEGQNHNNEYIESIQFINENSNFNI